MKNFLFKNKLIIILIFIILLLVASLFIKSFGMEQYENTEFSLGIVNTEYLNMRSGAGINFKPIDILTKNEYVRVFGQIGDWYIVQNEENKIGTVYKKYINEAKEEKASVTNSEVIENNEESILTEDETTLLSLINTERVKNDLPEFEIDAALQNVAKLKAEDIVKNNYFSHISPTYGTPFEMLKQYNIEYKTGSENIAGNSSITAALDSWMSSDSHKSNILSNEYNYTGIAVANSIAYGKIIVELFIGK